MAGRRVLAGRRASGSSSRYDQPRTTDRITVQQSDNGVQNRWITRVRLRFDGGDPVDSRPRRRVPERARARSSTSIGAPSARLTIEVLDDDVGARDRYDGLSPVGFADIRLGDGDRRLDEVIRLPRDLLTAAGSGSADQPLAIVLTRLRTRPSVPLRSDPELALARAFELPTARGLRRLGPGPHLASARPTR